MHKINIQPDKKENKIVREFNFKTRQYFEHRDYWNKCNKKKRLQAEKKQSSLETNCVKIYNKRF